MTSFVVFTDHEGYGHLSFLFQVSFTDNRLADLSTLYQLHGLVIFPGFLQAVYTLEGCQPRLK